MEISLAQTTDIPDLCILLAELFNQEADFEPDYHKQFLSLSHIVTHPGTGHIILARRNKQVLGMVGLLYTVSTALGTKVALLEDMVVRPDVRALGIGSKLLTTALDHARQCGCKRVTLLTDHDNGRAQAFYRRHGFTPSAMIAMRIDLTE